MPWRETDVKTERLQFVAACQRGLFSMTDLCEQFGIARKTGYKLLQRYAALGPVGLCERSRRPRSSPTATRREVVQWVLACRARHPHWGPKKLLQYLVRRDAHLPAPARTTDWPGVSTVARLLARAGVTAARGGGRARHAGPPAVPVQSTEPNDLWTADYKGPFHTGDGGWCYPLTVMDHCSRYLLRCEGLRGPTDAATRRGFEQLFLDRGLPRRIRTDNGTPFAGPGVGGLSPLSAWWIRLGITPERIDRGHPEQNPQHERLHRTLKAETARPPASTLRAQQGRFDRFQAEYNDERPHEALGFDVPATRYQASPRVLPRRVPPVEYPAHFDTRRVYDHGDINWLGRRLFVSEALAGEYLGLDEVDDGLWDLWFSTIRLARLDQRYWSLHPVGPQRRGAQ
jgi:transposase InsO family protein